MKRLFVIALAIVGSLFTAGCIGADGEPLTLQPDAQPVTSPAPDSKDAQSDNKPSPPNTSPPESGLLAALTYSPSSTQQILFTDWTAVHAAMGFDRARDTITDEWMLNLNREHVAASVYGGYHMREHADEWGWDTLDLQWEASLIGDGWAPLFVLRFHDDFDLAPVTERFESRDFTRTDYGGAALYTHDMDLSQDWLRTTDLQILNVALLEEEGAMILSASPETVQTVLRAWEAGDTLIQNDAALAVAQRLTGASTAVLMPGPAVCLSYTPNPLLDALGESVVDTAQLQQDALPARPQALYTVLGLGYYYPATDGVATDAAPVSAMDDFVWFVVMHFPTAELAELDLAPRLTLAEEGMSQASERAYTELFSVEAASVADTDVVLALAPVQDMRKSLLLTMLNHRDMLFAMCP